MADDLEARVAELARRVTDAHDLKTVDEWFHRSLVPFPPFLAESVQAVHRPLQTIAQGIARSYGFVVELRDPLQRLARLSLWHGALIGERGAMALLVYFDDQHRGVCSFGNLNDPMTHYARFSLPEEARDPDADISNLQLMSAAPRGIRGQA